MTDIVSNICAPVDKTYLVFDEEMVEIFHLNLSLLNKYIVIHIVPDIMFDIFLYEEQNCCYCNFVVCVLVFLLTSTCAHSRMDFSVIPFLF